MPNEGGTPHDQAIEKAARALVDSRCCYGYEWFQAGKIDREQARIVAGAVVKAYLSNLHRADAVSRSEVLRGLEEWYVQHGGDVCDFHKLADYVCDLPSLQAAGDDRELAHLVQCVNEVCENEEWYVPADTGGQAEFALRRFVAQPPNASLPFPPQPPAWTSEEELVRAILGAIKREGNQGDIEDIALLAARIFLRGPEPAAVCVHCGGKGRRLVGSGDPIVTTEERCPYCAPADEGGKR